jgi:hypothetical protein
MQFSPKLEEYRDREGYFKSRPGVRYGRFDMPGPCGERLLIIADDGEHENAFGGWEHVSISTARRNPNWQEMCFVKNLFWGPEECVVQYHPPESAYISNHPHVLHLWRWTRGEFPMPPPILVGDKKEGEVKDVKQAWNIKKRIDREAGF